MDNALAKAIERKAELERQRAELDSELTEIDLFLRLHEKFSGTKSVYLAPPMEHTDSHGGGLGKGTVSGLGAMPPLAERKRGRPADFAGIMERVLRDVGKPLSRPELVEELEKREVVIPSDDKPRYLGTILWRHRDRFINLPGFGYWLKDLAFAPASYFFEPSKDELLEAAKHILSEPSDEDISGF
jgi:hypothetical protein